MKKLILLFLLVSTPVYAQLSPNTRIPEGTCQTGASGVDVLCADSVDHALSIINNNGTRVNLPQVTILTSSFTNATTTLTQTALTFPVSASRNYTATCRITWQGSGTAAGPKYVWGGPTGATAVTVGLSSPITASTSAFSSALALSASGGVVGNTGTITATTNFTDLLTISVINGTTAGNVILYAAANGSGTLTIQPGSYCIYQ